MKVDRIYVTDSTPQCTVFKGLWGERYFVENESNSEFDCDYFKKKYYK